MFWKMLCWASFCPINSTLPWSVLERTWNLHTTRGHVYLVSNETTMHLCGAHVTRCQQLLDRSNYQIEHRKKKKKGYENSMSYHIATKHKHDTSKLVETFWKGHKISYQPLFYFSKLHQNNATKILKCATQNSQHWRSGNIVWIPEMLELVVNPQGPNIQEVTESHLKTYSMPNASPIHITPLGMWQYALSYTLNNTYVSYFYDMILNVLYLLPPILFLIFLYDPPLTSTIVNSYIYTHTHIYIYIYKNLHVCFLLLFNFLLAIHIDSYFLHIVLALGPKNIASA